jgi:hypothetical protein
MNETMVSRDVSRSLALVRAHLSRLLEVGELGQQTRDLLTRVRGERRRLRGHGGSSATPRRMARHVDARRDARDDYDDGDDRDGEARRASRARVGRATRRARARGRRRARGRARAVGRARAAFFARARAARTRL